MKKIITTVALLTFVLFAFGQKMDVGSGAYVTLNPGAYITVDGGLVTDGTFTIKSVSTGTGSLIVTGSGSTTTSGNVTVERFLTHDRWHYIAGQTNISGNFSTLSMGLTGGTNNDQFYRWDESLDWGGNIGNWVDILNGPNGNNSTMSSEGFVACKGYSINYINTDKTLSLSGVPYVADKSITMTKTSNSTAEGTNLVGNPFTSTIAANSPAQTTNNFIDKNNSVLLTSYKAIYLWDEQGSYDGTQDDYVTINNSSSATFLEPGQGFMVVAASNSSTLTFHQAIQKHGTASFSKAYKDNVWRFELKVTNPESMINKTLIAFNTGMTNGLDETYDARKMFGNPNLALYTRLVDDDGEGYAIQSLPTIGDGVSVKLGLRAEITGTYLIEPALIENFDDNVPINLEDKTTGIIQDLRKHPVYSFEVFETGIFDDRFVLHFKDAVGIEENAEAQNIQFYVSNNVLYILDEEVGNGTVSLFNLLGQTMMTKSIADNHSTINLDLPTGYYIVNIRTDKSSVNGKVFVR